MSVTCCASTPGRPSSSWRGRGEPTEEEQATFLGPTVDVEVVGISRHPADLTSDDPLSFFTALPPGFLRAYGGRVGEWFPLLAIDVGDAPSPAGWPKSGPRP